jgi:lantibiotic transport system permease protein
MQSFIANFKAEILKTKRSSAFWITVLGAGLIPFIMMLAYIIKPIAALAYLKPNYWGLHFESAWESTAAFLMPMYVVMASSLITQLEVKNNAWKQVYAAPLSITNIFGTKFLVIFIMIVFYFLLFIIFNFLGCVISNLIHSKFEFLKYKPNFIGVFKTGAKYIITILPLLGFQYLLSLQFKNFVAPIGIGIVCIILGLTIMNWEHVHYYPFIYSFLISRDGRSKVENLHQKIYIASVLYFLFFMILAFVTNKFKRER